jgi:streptogramin lyase
VVHVGPDGNFLFPEDGGIVRMLSRAPYTQTEFPIPGGGSFQTTTGPDGNIWFVQQGSQQGNAAGTPGQVGRILTHAPYTVTLFQVPDIATLYGITVGDDGNL